MSTRNRKRKGFTLVELLVVISIIGMLMALLLPAVQSAREAGRQNTCRNNLKNLALAMANYETQRSTYPGYVNDLTGLPLGSTHAAASSDNGYRSWSFVLLPYLDHRSLFDQLKDKDTALASTFTGTPPLPTGTPNTSISTTLELMNCPSNPPETLGNANSSYVVNVGQVDRATPVAANPTRDYAGNGVFHWRGRRYTSGTFAETLISMTSSYISAQDGMGTTIMMSENADAFTWPGPAAADTTHERYLGFGYHSADSTPGDPTVTPPPTPGDPYHINVKYSQSKTGGGTPLAQKVFMRPSAYHPSGVNMAFCDGRVRFINEDISYGVYQALMTPRGSQAYFNNGTIGPMPGTPANTTTPVHAATKTVDEAAIQ